MSGITGELAEQSAMKGQEPGNRVLNAEAIDQHRRAVAHAPRDATALAQLAAVLLRAGKRREAIDYLTKGVRTIPGHPGLLHLLGAAYLQADEPRSAEIQLRKALKLSPKSTPILRTLGDCCLRMQKAGEAESYYRKAAAAAPCDIESRMRLAGLLAYKGARADARNAYRALLADGVKHPLVYAGLIEASDYSDATDQPTEYAPAAELAENPAVPPPLRRMLHFAIARIDRAQNQREAEFERYRRGKSLFEGRFDLAYFGEVVAALKEAVTPALFADRQDFADKSERPLLVFGMPRSGTTLTEQMLSAHPQVSGAGELRFFSRAARALGISERRTATSLPPGAIAERIGSIAAPEAERLRAGYLDQLQNLGGGRIRVTDKMPHNFLHLWLIALLFPRATYIHCVRDPLATCFSCFTTDLGDAHDYTADFETLAGYYRLYKDLMQHWSSVLPIRIVENRYEYLVAEPENAVRRMLEAAKLPWHDACLKFHQRDRVAQTASYAAIREPVHARSLEKWRAYEEEVAPLREALARQGL